MEVNNFDIDQIMRSGQCFRINEVDPGKTYSVIHLDNYLEINVKEDGGYSFQCTPKELDEIWAPYFDLKSDVYHRAAGMVVPDEFLKAAVEHGSGIRILNQDLWETMVCFIASTRKTIPRIKECIDNICILCGSEHQIPGREETFRSIPTPEQMAAADLEQLRETGLYYRAPFIQNLAQKIADGEISLKYLKECMNFEKVHNILLSITGIGPKVASCVELFGLHHLQALPVDTWISKIISQKYNGYFPAHLYTGYEGLMQQYMFFYAIEHKEEFAEE